MSQDSTRWLRTTLKANGVFSALSALVLLLGDGLVAALLRAFDALGSQTRHESFGLASPGLKHLSEIKHRPAATS